MVQVVKANMELEIEFSVKLMNTPVYLESNLFCKLTISSYNNPEVQNAYEETNTKDLSNMYVLSATTIIVFGIIAFVVTGPESIIPVLALLKARSESM